MFPEQKSHKLMKVISNDMMHMGPKLLDSNGQPNRPISAGVAAIFLFWPYFWEIMDFLFLIACKSTHFLFTKIYFKEKK